MEGDDDDDGTKLLSELQLITSMYSESEIHFDDPEVNLRLENSFPIKASVSFSVQINDQLKLCLRVPSGYEKGEESISANCVLKESTNWNISRLNTEVNEFLKTPSNGEAVDILSIINFCSEQWELLSAEKSGGGILEADKEDELSAKSSLPKCPANYSRLWIHSHHIYNEKKRKFIVDNADNLSLKGFSLPGKPGFICVEGDKTACEEFWSRVRQLSWQKISLVEQEELIDSQLVFKSDNSFRELHLNMSEFMKYLSEKEISSVLKSYLGFDKPVA